MKQIAIIGCGGHTRSSVNLLEQAFEGAHKALYDDSYSPGCEESVGSMKLVGRIADIPSDSRLFLSVGDNTVRGSYYDRFGARVVGRNLLHHLAFTEDHVAMGRANQVFAHAYINAYATIGDDNIINSGAIIEHEVSLGSHNHISVGARVCGRSRIGSYCMIGAGATIIDKVSICDHVIVGAGSVVISDIVDRGTYVGVPARKLP